MTSTIKYNFTSWRKIALESSGEIALQSSPGGTPTTRRCVGLLMHLITSSRMLQRSVHFGYWAGVTRVEVINYSFLVFCNILQYTIPSFLHSFIRSFVRSFVRSFLRSFVPSFLRSFVRSFVRSFIPSLINFLHSYMHSFIHALCTQRRVDG